LQLTTSQELLPAPAVVRPSLQPEQTLALAEEYVPAAQIAQPVEFGAEVNFPETQLVQLVAFSAEKRPASQLVHKDCPRLL